MHHIHMPVIVYAKQHSINLTKQADLYKCAYIMYCISINS